MLFLDFLFFVLLAVGNFPSAVGIQVPNRGGKIPNCPIADATSFWAATGKDDGVSMVQVGPPEVHVEGEESGEEAAPAPVAAAIPKIDFGGEEILEVNGVKIPMQKATDTENFLLVGAGLRTKGPWGALKIYALGFFAEEKALFGHIQAVAKEPPTGNWNL